MQRKPKVSIIIPYYNVEKAILLKCIDSILIQKMPDYEIIIVNDGSDERYIDTLSKIESIDDRIKLFNEDNRGVSAARNYGVQQAKGEFVTFIDSDDIVHSEFLSQALELLSSQAADYVIGATLNVKECDRENILQLSRCSFDNNTCKVYECKQIKELRPCLIASNQMIRFRDKGYINRGPVARVIRTDLAKECCFPEGIAIGEDVIWNQMMLDKCRKVIVANNTWYYYIQYDSSSSHRYREDAVSVIESEGLMLKECLDLQEDILYRAFCQKILAETRLIICRSYLTRKENKASFFNKWRQFNKIYKIDPWKSITQRYFRLGDFKERIVYLLYIMRLYYPAAYLRDRLLN